MSAPISDKFDATPWEIENQSATRTITIVDSQGEEHQYQCTIHVDDTQDIAQITKKINAEFISKMAELAKSFGLGDELESVKVKMAQDGNSELQLEGDAGDGDVRTITPYNRKQQAQLSNLNQMSKTIFKTMSLCSECLYADIQKLATESAKLSAGERVFWGPKMSQENTAAIERSLSVISRITEEVEDPEQRDLMISEILARQLAYGNFKEYLKDNKDPLLEFKMKIGEREVTYRFEKELDLKSGYSAIIFTAKDAPPIVLFPGTSPSHGTRASGVTVLDDLHPMGPGAGIFSSGKAKLEEALEEYTDNGVHKAKVYGHSLGGALSVRTGIMLPHLVDSVEAFNPPRQGWGMKGKFKSLEKLHEQAGVMAHLLGTTKEAIIKVLNDNKDDTLDELKPKLYKLKFSKASDVDFHDKAKALFERAKSVKDKGYVTIPISLPALNSYIPKVNPLQQFHDLADMLEEEGISKEKVIEILNDMDVTETSFMRFTPEIKEKLLAELRVRLLDEYEDDVELSNKINAGDFDETFKTLIALARELRKEKYPQIPSRPTEEDFAKVEAEALKIDTITTLGHKFVGNVYALKIDADPSLAHGAPIFIRKQHKFTQLKNVDIDPHNKNAWRWAGNIGQTVATVFGYTLGSIFLNLSRFLFGSDSSTYHPIRFAARKVQKLL